MSSIKNEITIVEASKIAKMHMEIFIKEVSQGKRPEQLNILLEGESGIGKTAASHGVMAEVLGIEPAQDIEPKIYVHSNGLRIAAREFHGGSCDPSTFTIPSVEPSAVWSDRCKQFLDRSNDAGGSEKELLLDMAKKSLGAKLSFVLEDFFVDVVFGGKADLLFLLIQDPNKNPHPGMAALIKSFLDSLIANQKLPPTFVMLTTNPVGSSYQNRKMDATIMSAASVFRVKADQSSIPYFTKNYTGAASFFEENPEVIAVEPDSSDLTVGHPCPRSWAALLTILKHSEGDKERMMLFTCIALARVGKAATDMFMRWYARGRECQYVPQMILTEPACLARGLNKTTNFNAKNFIGRILALPKLEPVHILELVTGLSIDKRNIFLLHLYANQCAKEFLQKRYRGANAAAVESLYTRYIQSTTVSRQVFK